MEKFGEFIKKARKENKLTLREVEKKTGISNSYLSQIEKGKRGVPSINFILRLGSIYDLPSGKLMEVAVFSVLKERNKIMGMDKTECLQDQLTERYRDYLKELELPELIETLLWVAKYEETLKDILIDEIIHRDYSGQQDDTFKDQL